MKLTEQEFGKKWNEDAYACIAANAAVVEAWKEVVRLTLAKLPEIENRAEAERAGQWLGKAFADSFAQRHPFNVTPPHQGETPQQLGVAERATAEFIRTMNTVARLAGKEVSPETVDKFARLREPVIAQIVEQTGVSRE
jgi:hypothetical protein